MNEALEHRIRTAIRQYREVLHTRGPDVAEPAVVGELCTIVEDEIVDRLHAAEIARAQAEFKTGVE